MLSLKCLNLVRSVFFLKEKVASCRNDSKHLITTTNDDH